MTKVGAFHPVIVVIFVAVGCGLGYVGKKILPEIEPRTQAPSIQLIINSEPSSAPISDLSEIEPVTQEPSTQPIINPVKIITSVTPITQQVTNPDTITDSSGPIPTLEPVTKPVDNSEGAVNSLSTQSSPPSITQTINPDGTTLYSGQNPTIEPGSQLVSNTEGTVTTNTQSVPAPINQEVTIPDLSGSINTPTLESVTTQSAQPLVTQPYNDPTIVPYSFEVTEKMETFFEEGESITKTKGMSYNVNATISTSYDGERFAIGGLYNQIYVFDYVKENETLLSSDFIKDKEIFLPPYYNHSSAKIECYNFDLSGDGNVIAFASIVDGSSLVQIFLYNESQWVQMGNNITEPSSLFTSHTNQLTLSLSEDGKTLAIGSYKSNKFGVGSGEVQNYIFDSSSEEWTETQIIMFQPGFGCGKSISLSADGTKIAIGCYRSHMFFINSGHVVMYEYVNGTRGNVNVTTWTPIGQKILGYAENSKFGISVSLSENGNLVAFGSKLTNGEQKVFDQFHVYEYNGQL